MDVIESMERCGTLFIDGKYFSDWHEVDNLRRKGVSRNIDVLSSRHLGDIPDELLNIQAFARCIKRVSGMFLMT